MMQNSSIDKLMAEIPWAGAAAQPMYNNLSRMLLEEVPHLYIAHAQQGVVANAGWKLDTPGYFAPLGQGLIPHYVGGERMTAAPPPAPPDITEEQIIIIAVVASVSVVALVAVALIYRTMKKRK